MAHLKTRRDCGFSVLKSGCALVLGITGLLLSYVIYSGSVSRSDQPSDASSVRASPTPTRQENAKESQVRTTLEERLRPIFGDSFGQVSAFCGGPGEKCAVLIEFFSNSSRALEDKDFMRERPMRGALVRSLERQMRDAYQVVFTSSPNIEDAVIQARVKSDSEQENPGWVVYATGMTKKIASKIHWEKRESLDFTKLWETRVRLAQYLDD